MAKWSELERQGVERCCAEYSTGQCRRRADVSDTAAKSGFCKRCGPKMVAALEPHKKAIRDEAKQN